jgi:hypothetical protein
MATMANEWDRQIIPSLMQTGITLSFGAAWRSIELIKDPQKAFETMSAEVKEMLTVPEEAGEGLENKVKAVAGVWMEKGMNAVETCRKAGRQFTQDE